MKQNQTIIAAVVLVVLAFLYWLTLSGEADTKSVDPDILKFDKELVSTIKVTTPDAELNFVKEAQNWVLDGYPVDTTRMERFLDLMSGLEADRVISKNEDKYSKYEVDETGTQISFHDNNNKLLKTLIIGKLGSNYQESFVKRGDKTPIYAVLASLSTYKEMKQRDFWDKTITDLNVDALTTVNFAGEYNFKLERQGPVWSFNGEQVDFEKVQNMLRSLEHMKASNFIDDIPEDKVWYQSIEMVLESGESIQLRFSLKDENASTLLLDASNRSKKFEYPKSSLNRFNKSLDDLKSEPVE